MRIISGKYGGRKLVAFKASHIRPTTDRVKEVIFNKLQFDIEGARVLDLYAGTGNLSFESLSRGAEYVHAIENHAKSIAIIKQNQELLKISKEDLKITKQDVISFLRASAEFFDIILIDPPFTKELADETLLALSQSKLLESQPQVFIESAKRERIADSYGSLVLQERKDYGDKFLSQFVVSGE